MRKPYSKLLRKKFSEMVRGLELPFEEFSGKSEYLLPIDYAHVHRVNEKLWLFLVLYINPKGRQCFTVQFGWSTLGRFPEVLDMRFPDLEVKKERFREKEHFQRVAVFLGHDQWWYLEGDKKNWLGHLDGDPIDLTSEDVERSVNK